MTNTDTTQTETQTVEPEAPAVETPEPEARPEREAAKYRRQLRDAEAERDGLATRLEAMQRAEAERIAGDRLAKGGALWAAGVALEDVLSEDGTVDAEKVGAAATAARKTLGLAAPPHGPIIPNQGTTPADNPSYRGAGIGGFAGAFAPPELD